MRIFFLLVMISFGSLFAAECTSGCGQERCLTEDWYFYGDWLWWKARRSGTDFVAIDFTTKGQYECVEPRRESGFRVGFYRDSCAGWNYGFNYTHFETGFSDRVLKNNRLHSSRTAADFSPMINGDFAQSEFQLRMKQLDFEAGYLIGWECANILLRPIGGVRVTYIDQCLETFYDQRTPPGDGVFNAGAVNVKEKLNMDSYGLFCGIQLDRDLICGFRLVGRYGRGIALGDFEVNFHQASTATQGKNFTSDKVKGNKREWLMVPSTEMSIALQYDIRQDECMDLSIQVGYEMHHWCRLPGFPNFVDDLAVAHLGRNGSNLGLEGLFVQGNASF